MKVFEETMKIGRPCYLSFEWAMFYHGLIDQPIYKILCATLRDGFRSELDGFHVEFISLPEDYFFGFGEVWDSFAEERFLIAEPEKAILDYLCKQRDEGYSPYLLFSVDWERVDMRLLQQYADLMDPSLFVEVAHRI